MSQEVLVLLRGLLSADKQVRTQYEKLFQEAKVGNPDMLAESLTSALAVNEPAVQQMAAVLLRRLLEDEDATGAWARLSPDRRLKLRQNVLSAIWVASGRSTLRAITYVVAQLSRLCLKVQPNAQTEWPELLKTIFDTSQSPDAERRESGFQMFAAVAEYAPRAVAQHHLVIGEVLGKGLKDPDSVDVRLASLKALASLMVALDPTELAPFRAAVPIMLETLQSALDQAATTHDERLETVSRDAIKALIDIVGEHPKFLRPDFEAIAKTMLAIASAEGLASSTRSLGLEFLVAAANSMPSYLRKEQPVLASELIPLAMRLMCEKENPRPDMQIWERNLEGEADDDEGDELFSAAEAAVHRLAQSLGGKTVLSKVLSIVPVLLTDRSDWRRRKTAVETLSLMAEGCGKKMYAKLSDILKMVSAVARDEHPKVRYAVIHLIGRLCLDFGDDQKCGDGKPSFQKKFGAQVLPMLAEYLRDPNPRVSCHAATSLVNFFSEFGDLQSSDVAPYLDSLVEGLILQITNGSVTAKDDSLAAVSSIATVSGPMLFGRYYDHLMPLALGIASNPSLPNSEMVSSLRGRSLECAGLMAAAVGQTKFAGDASKVLGLVLQCCHQTEDSTLRNYAIAAAVRVGKAVGDDFLRFVPELIPDLVKGCKEEFGLELIDAGDAEEMRERGFQIAQFSIRGEGIKTIKVNNAAVQEISTCAFALYNLAVQFKQQFAPFAPEAFGAILLLIDADAVQAIRNIAIVSLPHLISCVAHQPSVASDMFVLSFFACLAKIKAEEDATEGETDAAELADALDTTLHLAESLTSIVQACYESNGARDNDPYLEKRVSDHPPLYGFSDPKQLKEGVELAAEVLQRRIETIIERRAMFEEEKAEHDETTFENFMLVDAKHYEVAERLVDVCGYLIKLCCAASGSYVPVLREHLFPIVLTLSMDEARDDIKRFGVCLLDDLVEFLPYNQEDAPIRGRLLKLCLENANGEDPMLARSSVWGLGLLAVYGGPEVDDVSMDCVRALAETVEKKRAFMSSLAGGEDDDETIFNVGLAVDNALSALEKFCRHRGAALTKRGLAPESVLQRVVQMLPCTADADEARVINVQIGRYVGTPFLSKPAYVHLLISQLIHAYDNVEVEWNDEYAFLDERTRMELARGLARGEFEIPPSLSPEEMGMVAELGRWFAKKEAART